MASVTYHGEFPEGQVDEDGNAFIVHLGQTFTRGGKAVSVSDKETIAKFAANRFFKTEGSDAEDVKDAKAEAEQAEVQALRDWLGDNRVPFHHREGLASLRAKRADYEASVKSAGEE
jgi:hypothetical protein